MRYSYVSFINRILYQRNGARCQLLCVGNFCSEAKKVRNHVPRFTFGSVVRSNQDHLFAMPSPLSLSFPHDCTSQSFTASQINAPETRICVCFRVAFFVKHLLRCLANLDFLLLVTSRRILNFAQVDLSCSWTGRH
jgi:hypothetical protein